MNTRIIVAAKILVLSVFSLSIGCETYTVEVEEVKDRADEVNLLEDDNLNDKHPEFEPELVDSRPVEDWYGDIWELNASAAVIGLDVPGARDGEEDYLLELYPSYVVAAKALAANRLVLLPSINMLDGKAKQFDDGLYAELDAAMSFGKMRGFNDTSALLLVILEELDPSSEAYAWVWGGLELGIEDFAATRQSSRPKQAEVFIDRFNSNEIESKPIGFYTWSEELERTFRMLRYFQRAWPADSKVPVEFARIFEKRPDLFEQYQRILAFYARLTNPFNAYSFADLVGKVAKMKKVAELSNETFHFVPYSTSREVELINGLFPDGLPVGADLMKEFVKAIRDGRVDLTPGTKSGWYDYQVYALETFLLPARGKECDKLLLTKQYKERMLQAFKALVTKRRETHVRQLGIETSESVPDEPPPPIIALRLRLEPNPTYYLRTGRSYAFLQTFLEATIPPSVAERLTGRREGGYRDVPLFKELEYMRNLFYGFHLVSCEDIGMRPELLDGELDDISGGAAECMDAALEWLQSYTEDPDLDKDTRVSVPIYKDTTKRTTTLLCTLGVRGAKLRAWYASAPRWRPKNGRSGQGQPAVWESIDPEILTYAKYILLVDEFAEITLRGYRTLSREEFRARCDRYRTKEEIVKALSGD